MDIFTAEQTRFLFFVATIEVSICIGLLGIAQLGILPSQLFGKALIIISVAICVSCAGILRLTQKNIKQELAAEQKRKDLETQEVWGHIEKTNNKKN